MQTVVQQSFWDRLGGVIALKRPAYDAIPGDPAATGQAWLIVILQGIANGIAYSTTPFTTFMPDMSDELADDMAWFIDAVTIDTTSERFVALALGIVGAAISWYLSSWLLRLVGKRLATGQGDSISGEGMRRLVAWGYSPSLASFLTPIPAAGPLLATLGALWAFVTGVMAVRAAFNVGIGKAIGIEIVAFFVFFVMLMLIVIAAVILAALVA